VQGLGGKEKIVIEANLYVKGILGKRSANVSIHY